VIVVHSTAIKSGGYSKLSSASAFVHADDFLCIICHCDCKRAIDLFTISHFKMIDDQQINKKKCALKNCTEDDIFHTQ
jgi:hypothetical protein